MGTNGEICMGAPHILCTHYHRSSPVFFTKNFYNFDQFENTVLVLILLIFYIGLNKEDFSAEGECI